MSEIYLAGGCFWGTEKYLSSIPGVLSTQTGYANGTTDSPTYEEVCNQNTGHAETVRVVYDPQKLSLGFLLELYYGSINPLSLNRQGGDVGRQYRTGIYYTDADDLPVIEQSLARLQKRYDRRIRITSRQKNTTRNTWTRTRAAIAILPRYSLKRSNRQL